jgi:hypothetical protein
MTGLGERCPRFRLFLDRIKIVRVRLFVRGFRMNMEGQIS